jgi:putative tricarboxylic transport membrane protein
MEKTAGSDTVITDISIAGVMLVVGAYGMYEMVNLPEIRGEGVGPAFYPIVLSAILIALSAVLIAKSVSRVVRNRAESQVALNIVLHSWIRPGILFFATLLYAILFKTIGFPILTIGMLTGLSYMLDESYVSRKIVFAILFTLAAWVVFQSFLGLPLPLGFIRRFL